MQIFDVKLPTCFLLTGVFADQPIEPSLNAAREREVDGIEGEDVSRFTSSRTKWLI
jgi:hypothetical protein